MLFAVLALTMFQSLCSAQDCTDSSCDAKGRMLLQKTTPMKAVTSAIHDDEDDAKHMHETHEDSDPEWDSAMYNPLTTGPPPDPDGSHVPLNETIPNNESALLELSGKPKHCGHQHEGKSRRRREWATCEGTCSGGGCFSAYISRTWCYCNTDWVREDQAQAFGPCYYDYQHCTGKAWWR